MLVKCTEPVAAAGVGYIPLGGGNYAIVDENNLKRLSHWRWHLHRFGATYYAARSVRSKNSTFHVYMHRQIMHTLKGQVVHHLNGRGLDNREANMLNCTKEQHNFYH